MGKSGSWGLLEPVLEVTRLQPMRSYFCAPPMLTLVTSVNTPTLWDILGDLCYMKHKNK